MPENKLNTTELREKILKGIDLAIEKIILKKQKEDGEFVFSKNGEIIIIKANDLET